MLPLNSQSDARDRFEQFYARHQAWVLTLVIRLTRDRDLAADISQTVWTKILSRWEILEPRISGTGVAWLRTVVVNALYDHFRRLGCRPEMPLDPEVLDRLGVDAGDLFEDACSQEQRRILDSFVRGLSPGDQALVELLVDRAAARAGHAALIGGHTALWVAAVLSMDPTELPRMFYFDPPPTQGQSFIPISLRELRAHSASPL